jgi:hypothetical protein
MSESSKSLQVADTRSPFAKALHILRDGGSCPDDIVSDLSSLIVELSKKHFGITSEVMVEGAVQGADSLVSVALILASGRNHSDIKLSEILKSEGLRGVCAIFTKYVKEITEGDGGSTSPKLVLEAFFLASSVGWNAGYRELQRLHSISENEKSMVLVKEWLKKTPQGRILHNKPTDDSHVTSQFIRRVLLQYCGVKDTIESDFSVNMDSDGPINILIELGPIQLKSAKLRFKDLISKMPLKLRLALEPLNSISWFDENVCSKKSSPVAIPEKAMKKPLKKATKSS